MRLNMKIVKEALEKNREVQRAAQELFQKELEALVKKVPEQFNKSFGVTPEQVDREKIRFDDIDIYWFAQRSEYGGYNSVEWKVLGRCRYCMEKCYSYNFWSLSALGDILNEFQAGAHVRTNLHTCNPTRLQYYYAKIAYPIWHRWWKRKWR